jgi:hypothetical protein
MPRVRCLPHDRNACTFILFICVNCSQSCTHIFLSPLNTICQRSETRDRSPTYLKLLLHKPDEERRSHMFLSAIRNHLQHHHALHHLQKKGPCLLEYQISTMIMKISPPINYPSDLEHPERWVYTFMEFPID